MDSQPESPLAGEEVLTSMLQWGDASGRRPGPYAGLVKLNWTADAGLVQPFNRGANSQREYVSNLTVEQLGKMFDVLDRDGQSLEMIYFTGADPAGHPQLGEFIELARSRGISLIGLHCDGLRIAFDNLLLESLSRLKPLLFVEFDGFDETASLILHGRRDIPFAAKRGLDRLATTGLSAALLASVARGVNLQEVGAIAAFGMKHPAVFGTVFKPISPSHSRFGASAASHVTAAGIMDALEQQGGGLFNRDAFSPVFCCPPDRHFVARIPRTCGELIGSGLTSNDHSPSGKPEPCYWLGVHEFMTPWSKDTRQARRCPLIIMTADGRTIPYCLYSAEG